MGEQLNSDDEYDLVVVGAGINGAGIARDAALRGLKVLLLEQGDICAGTSGWSSRLIHGGLRYLEYGELPLVRESLRERATLLKTAPHLVRPLAITIPVFTGARRGKWIIGAGMLAYDILSWDKSLAPHRMLSREQILDSEAGLADTGLRSAAVYFDAQVTFAERLVVENVLSAARHGAVVRTGSKVVKILSEGGRVCGVNYVDRDRGLIESARSTVVVNAAGPWVDQVLEGLGQPLRKFMGGTKGSHIVVDAFESAPGSAFYVEASSDGRPFFIIPWNRQYLIGTTDIRYTGDPGEARASAEEIDYLLAETKRVFPRCGLSRERIRYSYSGVRPLPRRPRGSEGAITRRHIIKHHRRVARGLLSIIGGKLTTYRNLAEQTVDRVFRLLGRDRRPCLTAGQALPGGEAVETSFDGLELSRQSQSHLLETYGSRTGHVIELLQAEPGLRRQLCPHSGAIAAEMIVAFRDEYARTLTDFLQRRCMAGLSQDFGLSAAGAATAVAGEYLGWDAARQRQELEDYRKYARRFLVEAP